MATLAMAKREAARILMEVGREMLRAGEQERLIRKGRELSREAADLELANKTRNL